MGRALCNKQFGPIVASVVVATSVSAKGDQLVGVCCAVLARYVILSSVKTGTECVCPSKTQLYFGKIYLKYQGSSEIFTYTIILFLTLEKYAETFFKDG